ncbi:protein of unknown function [Streptomyces murinus]
MERCSIPHMSVPAKPLLFLSLSV